MAMAGKTRRTFLFIGASRTYSKNHEWHFGDEVSKPVNIKYSFKNYPDPDAVKTKEFREFWKQHLQ